MVETIFQIKRSPGSAAPTSLLFGEPAWVEATNTLYIGRSDNTVVGIPFGASYQPSSSRLNELAVLSPTNGAFLVGNGSSFALQSGAGARSLLGLGSAAIAASTDFVSAAEKGAAGGVATLDGTGKVPASQLSPPYIPVLSVFGRTGSITSQAGDYSAAQVGALAIANNLSDLTSVATARANLGLGTAAIVNTDNLLNRVNHTGTQAISTIAGLETALNSKLSGSELNNHVSAPILDHPDGSVTDIKIGNRTVSDVAAPTNLGPGSLTQWFGWLVNRVKSITGKSNWWETPATTLEATANHLANTSNPHNVTAAQIGAIATTEKGVANGVATLDGAGKVPTAQIPPIAINETFPVNSEAEQLALTAEVGDFAVRLDTLKTFILRLPGPSTLSNWQEVLTPTSAVTSVFGRTGVVGAQPGDYTAAQVGALAIASDLSDLNSPSIARNNLGLGSLAIKSSLLAADIPNLDAAKITTGVFGDSQIPASIARDSEVQSAVSTKIDAIEKGAPGGVASLDANGQVPTAQLPELGAVQSVFGRIGVVEAEVGDYGTDQVVEGVTNLYFTVARSRNSLSATGPLAYNAATGTFSVPNTTATWNANQLQGRAISTTAPTDLQSLRWNNSLSQWEPQTATVLSANITDSTAIGRSLLSAVDAAAARTAIGAITGPSSTAGAIARYADAAGNLANSSITISDSGNLAIASASSSTTQTNGSLTTNGGIAALGRVWGQSFTANLTGSTKTSPISLWSTTGSTDSSTGVRYSLFSSTDGLQLGRNATFQIYSPFGVEIRGNQGSGASPPAFGVGAATNACLSAIGTTAAAPVIIAKGATGQTGNLFEGQTDTGAVVASISSAGNLSIASTTASTSTTTGAATIAGGVGVGGAINSAGPINVKSPNLTTAYLSGGIGTSTDVGIYPTTAITAGGNYWILRHASRAGGAFECWEGTAAQSGGVRIWSNHNSGHLTLSADFHETTNLFGNYGATSHTGLLLSGRGQRNITFSGTNLHGVRIAKPPDATSTGGFTVPNAATLTIDGPYGGTPITNSYSLLVSTGASRFGGDVAIAGILSAPNSAGTDTAGADFRIAGGQSTGAGAGGKILLQAATAAGTTGTSLNALATIATVESAGVRISANKNLIFGTGSGLHLTRPDGVSNIVLGIDGNNTRLGVIGGGSILFHTSSSTKMTIAGTGEVAIASTTASTAPTNGALTVAGGLGVVGAVNSASVGTNYLSLSNGDSSSGTTRSIIKFGFLANGTYSHFIATRHNDGFRVNNAIDFYTSTGLASGTYPADAVHCISITNGGLLVGTKTDDQINKLQVAGSAAISGNVAIAGRTTQGAPATAPTDANLANSQLSFWVDEVTGALKVRVRLSDGTLRTGTITLE